MKLYRYDSFVTGQGWSVCVEVILHEFKVIKETPCGFWIENFSALWPRWVKKHAHKKYACPTTDEARTSYYARKHRQVKILETQLQIARLALEVPIPK